MSKRSKVYFNSKQLEFMKGHQETKVFLGGRGSGKSTVIAGLMRLYMGEMPRSKGFLSSTTYNQILTKALPSISSKLEDMGIIEGVHYVMGQRPPKHFILPYSKISRFEYVMSFCNGFAIEFLSLDRPDQARGGSYDFGFVDEAALVKKVHINKVLLPSIRGNIHRFRSKYHQQLSLYSSLPWLPSGYYLYDYEEKARAQPSKYQYLEASAMDNIHILGQAGLDRMKEELSYIEYQMEVLNVRMRKVEDGFYHKLDETRHLYTPKYGYDTGPGGLISKGPQDVDRDRMLCASFDYGGWFNCCTVYQETNRVEQMLRQFYVKEGDQKVNELIDKFCNHFEAHRFKHVAVYGEPRGHDRQSNSASIYEQVKTRFEYNGWTCSIEADSGRTKQHSERHILVNEILSEEYEHLPKLRINKDHCKDVIISMQTTSINHDFTKNKSKEKDRNFNQEHATHFTDTVDYYFYQKYKAQLDNDIMSLLPGSASF